MRDRVDKRANAEEAERRIARLERLQTLTAALSAAATPSEVAQIVFDAALSALQARSFALFWERTPGQLELVDGRGLSPAFLATHAVLGPEAGLPGPEAWRTGEPLWLSSPEELAARLPAAAPLVAQDGDGAWAAVPLVVGGAPRGAIGVQFEGPRTLDAVEREYVQQVAGRCAQALERAGLLAATQRLADRLASLQAVTAALSAALEPRDVALAVFHGLTAAGAKVAAIYALVDEVLEAVYAQGEDPDRVSRLRRVRLDDTAPVADAARTGKAIWLDSPAAIREAYPDREEHRARRDEGAWAIVPLELEGRITGVLAATFPVGRRLDEEDRRFVGALAQQAAQALERARLYDAQRRSIERFRQVHSASAALSGAATPAGVAEAAFRGLAGLGASSAALFAHDGPERLVPVARHGSALVEGGLPLHIDAPAPAAEVARTGKALWLETPEAIVARFPGGAPEAAGGLAVVPLLAGGETLGVLEVAFSQPRPFGPDDKAFVRLLATPCAQALDRARVFETVARLRTKAELDAATLDAMFAAAPVGLALFDRQCRFTRINAHLAAVNGVAPEAHLGRTPAEVIPGIPGDRIAAAFRTVIETGEAVPDVEHVGETAASPGVVRRWVASWFPVRIGGAIAGVGVVVREVDPPPAAPG